MKEDLTASIDFSTRDACEKGISSSTLLTLRDFPLCSIDYKPLTISWAV